MEKIEVSAKTVEEAVTEALIQLGTTSDKIGYDVVEKGSAGILGIGKKAAVIQAWKIGGPDVEVQSFLKSMFEAMKMEVDVELTEDKENHTMNIDLRGSEMGILIGKRGQTLDSIQYLVNLVANKHSEDYIRVKVDTENYRKRRKDTLENLAKNIAYKVKRTKRNVSLEPMNPYERRIIHSTLQGDRYVTTHSEGDEPFRHVVVVLKKEK